ncbi:MAG: cystathionine beta-lyase [Alphaproteobacteria bacterium]
MTNHEQLDHEQLDTQLVNLGRDPKRDLGSVNPPVHRTSTVIFPDFAAFDAYEEGKSDHRGYGRYGTPTSDALEEALVTLEGADHAITTASGLAAITTSMLAFLSAGDHVLVPDSIYSSARHFVRHELPRFGVEVEFYDPTIGAGISKLMLPNTRVVYCESPGSLTFEMQDIPAIAKAAHAAGAIVMADNTWATPILQRPFDLGIDLSIHSATKYIAGHSDLVMGAITCKKAHYPTLKRMHKNLGAAPSSDNCYLALRGLRTMALRLKQHQENALILARWFQQVPEVARVLYPALPEDPGHKLWQRDMTGACGLFAVELKTPMTKTAIAALLDGLKHFGMGFSWGGFESLVIAYQPAKIRSATRWNKDAWFLRFHIGLEDPTDLITDLEAGFARLRKVLKQAA